MNNGWSSRRPKPERICGILKLGSQGQCIHYWDSESERKTNSDEFDKNHLQVIELSFVSEKRMCRGGNSNGDESVEELVEWKNRIQQGEKGTTILSFLAFLSVVFAWHHWDIQAFSSSVFIIRFLLSIEKWVNMSHTHLLTSDYLQWDERQKSPLAAFH